MSHPLLADKSVITLALAKELLAAAESEILARGWGMYVAFVDDAGTPVLVAGVNNAQPASWKISIRKAQSAARFRRATKVWEERVKGGAPNVMTLPGVIASEGGVPLLFQGRVIGAVGISGGTGAEDGVIGQVVVEALAQKLT
jgi:glc operon protein GlcG